MTERRNDDNIKGYLIKTPNGFVGCWELGRESDDLPMSKASAYRVDELTVAGVTAASYVDAEIWSYRMVDGRPVLVGRVR